MRIKNRISDDKFAVTPFAGSATMVYRLSYSSILPNVLFNVLSFSSRYGCQSGCYRKNFYPMTYRNNWTQNQEVHLCSLHRNFIFCPYT